VLPGARDVTSSIGLDPIRFHYDRSSHTVTVYAEIINKGKQTLRSPLTIVGLFPHSDFGEATVSNSAGYVDGQPYWDASPLLNAGALTPGSHSKPLRVVVKLAPFRPLPSTYLSGDAFSFAVRAYELKR
jgi:hypothetical protein